MALAKKKIAPAVKKAPAKKAQAVLKKKPAVKPAIVPQAFYRNGFSGCCGADVIHNFHADSASVLSSRPGMNSLDLAITIVAPATRAQKDANTWLEANGFEVLKKFYHSGHGNTLALWGLAKKPVE